MKRAPAPKGVEKVSHWFTGETSDMLARKHEIWTLLGWYHHRVVEPQLGFLGALRRLWWTITGRTARLSPWRDITERIERMKAARQVMAKIEEQRDAESAPPATADTPGKPERPNRALDRSNLVGSNGRAIETVPTDSEGAE